MTRYSNAEAGVETEICCCLCANWQVPKDIQMPKFGRCPLHELESLDPLNDICTDFVLCDDPRRMVQAVLMKVATCLDGRITAGNIYDYEHGTVKRYPLREGPEDPT